MGRSVEQAGERERSDGDEPLGGDNHSKGTALQSSDPLGKVDAVTPETITQEGRGTRQVSTPHGGIFQRWWAGVQVQQKGYQVQQRGYWGNGKRTGTCEHGGGHCTKTAFRTYYSIYV